MSPLMLALLAGGGFLLLGGKKKGARGKVPGTDIPLPPPPDQPPVEVPPDGPPSLTEQQRAEAMSPDIEQDLKSNKFNYDHARMREFQRLARIAVDGVYGPVTYQALTYYLKREAPGPLYVGADGTWGAPKYTPPSS